MEDLGKPLEDVTSERICVWLETLLEGLEVMDVPHETEAIIVRTNIYKLAEAIDRDLYVKSEKGAQISQRIHTHLEELSRTLNQKTKQEVCPIELRCVLVKGGTPHPLN